MTFLDPDVVQLVHDYLELDPRLKAIEGLSIETVIDGTTIANTAPGGKGNQFVVISQPQCSPAELNCGLTSPYQVRKYVKIEAIARAVKGADKNAKQLCDVIFARINELMFGKSFDGTGWLQHREVTDVYPSAPMDTLGYHVLTYEVLCSIGNN